MKTPLTPEEFYQQEFSKDYSIVLHFKESKLFSFSAMIMFTELYKKYLIEFNSK